jgi:hypothetical protein
LKIGNLLTPYIDLVENLKTQFFPNVSIECPIKPGKYYALNINEYMGDDKLYLNPKDDDQKPRNMLGVELPNGKYRFTFKISSKRDPFIYLVQWELLVRIRLNDENF